MTPTLESLGLDRLTVAERMALVGDIWDSIAAEVERAPLTAEQAAEVDRRLAAHAADPSAAVPWDQVKAAVRAKLRK